MKWKRLKKPAIFPVMHCVLKRRFISVAGMKDGDFQHFLSGIARLDQPFLLLYEQFPFHMAAAHSLGYGSRTGRCTRVYQKQINYNRSGRRAALMHVKYRAGFVFQYSLCLPLGHESSRSILLVKPARTLLILTYAPDLDNKS